MPRSASPRVCLDSDVVLYLASNDPAMAARTRELLAKRPTVSAQVLNEVINVLSNKYKFDWPYVEEFVELLTLHCKIVPLKPSTNLRAIAVCKRYKLNWFDSLIVASALEAKADVLMSEDMHTGLLVENTLRIQNPFAMS